MNERKILRELAVLLNTNIENTPAVLKRFKKESEELFAKTYVEEKQAIV
ncbi:MAG: hypothetical protein HZB65_05045 [Candidatus Aenigmarchaeota archaeon]|nr:hypothetical protein [Candidatus Aenigmarchaeota archaeon]